MAEINLALPDLQRTEQSHHFALSWVSLLLQPLRHPLQFNRDLSCGVAESSTVGLVHHSHFLRLPNPTGLSLGLRQPSTRRLQGRLLGAALALHQKGISIMSKIWAQPGAYSARWGCLELSPGERQNLWFH